MCNKCKQRGLDRRSFLAVGGAGVFMSALLSAGLRNALAAAGPSTALTPDQALDALRSGNQRYLNDPQVCQADLGLPFSVAPTAASLPH
jgi:carbonic anhydrase